MKPLFPIPTCVGLLMIVTGTAQSYNHIKQELTNDDHTPSHFQLIKPSPARSSIDVSNNVAKFELDNSISSSTSEHRLTFPLSNPYVLKRRFPSPTASTRSMSRSRVKRQIRVQNEMERFYLCLFTLFTNPNCNNYNNGQHQNIAPLFPPPHQQNQGHQRLGLFGLPMGGNGIFGGQFGMNNRIYPQQQQSTFNQTPYPDPQVNRRPGPATTTATTSTTTTTTTPKPTTTTPKPTTTTARPTTRRWSYTLSSSRWSAATSTSKPTTAKSVQSSSISFKIPCPNATHFSTHSTTTPTTTTTTTAITTTRSSLIKTISAENSALKSDLESSKKDLTAFQVQNKYLQEALNVLQTDNAKLKSRISTLEGSNEQLQLQNGQLQHSTGDQRTQLNEARSKIKYLEDKMYKLTRQGIEDQKEVKRLRNRIRDLTKEGSDCRASLYESQLDNKQTFVRERDDILQKRSSTEVSELEFRDDSAETTTIGSEVVADETATDVIVEDETPAPVPEVTTIPEVTSTTTTTTTTTTPKPTTTTATTTSTTPASLYFDDVNPTWVYKPLTISNHPDLIFDDDVKPFSIYDGLVAGENYEQKFPENSGFVVVGTPEDFERSPNLNNFEGFGSPQGMMNPYNFWHSPFTVPSNNYPSNHQNGYNNRHLFPSLVAVSSGEEEEDDKSEERPFSSYSIVNI